MPIGASLEVIDCMGGTISPGMVDIQINGGFGVDLSEFTSPIEYLTGLDKLSEELLRMGVTSYVPTVISQKPEVYKKILPLLMERAGKSPKLGVLSATPLGFHVEGPFLAPLKKGCHPSENIAVVNEGLTDFENMYGSEAVAPNREMVRIVTVAPDVQGVLPCIPELSERGITVALGHTNATTEQALQGIINGATLLTHIFNAMPPLHHRDPSIIGLLGLPLHQPTQDLKLLSDAQKVHSAPVTPILTRFKRLFTMTEPLVEEDESLPDEDPVSVPRDTPFLGDKHVKKACMTCSYDPCDQIDGCACEAPSTQQCDPESEGQMASRPSFSIIADGVHVHPQAVALAYRAYPEGCILISDAMHFMDPDLPDGVYPWRESAIEKRGMTLTLDGTDTLAGSILPMPEAVINLSKFADIPLERAIACATYTPAKLLGGLFKESHGLVPGCKADVLLWDKEGLKGVWKRGREVWRRSE
ncbi:hypothetical protein TREMEDRAFT_58621 [Tremella mesenterica DSM 1558]|uniref:uncharacterized protein n=1 Tax=Tremella mesenterica (strain ATCC 24925 / CBS 8224 / DSM 1558 / NBRC 9311 / NRRL Y-6157 / RJB 2259-6 / UBC 559-6) TaxID=578456 RepID=UPI0003F4A54E|nr:uncharacterized protein TREMEDRAFT_58621 [Tremella mesenterica DSM 1558]EIW72457.1 hypothetical protein TREMEDRAFT_58621 [Tremella mesenterica DSM 1558]